MGLLGLLGHEYLLNSRLHSSGCLTQHFGAGRYSAHMHQLQTLALYFFNHHTENFPLFLFIFRQEHQSRAVLSLLGHRNSLQQNELMRYLQHNTSTITRFISCLGTSVLHVFQHA